MFMPDPQRTDLAPDLDPVAADVRAVIDLFTGELAKVAFPDVDAAILQRELDAVRARSRDVAKARAALAAAEAALADRARALGLLAARGLAYARIYAEAHPELTALAASLGAAEPEPTVAASPPPKRRGRPPKAARTELPFEHADAIAAPA